MQTVFDSGSFLKLFLNDVNEAIVWMFLFVTVSD